MIYVFRKIYWITKEGLKSLLYDIDGNYRGKTQAVLFFVLIPIIISAFFLLKKVDISEIIDAILTILSIFTALIFGVLFTVPDKLSQRIERLNKSLTDNDTKNYLIRFSNFTKGFVQQISFVIVLSISSIIFLISHKLCDNFYLQLILTAVNVILFYYLIMYILIILSNIYTLLMDDIEISNKNISK